MQGKTKKSHKNHNVMKINLNGELKWPRTQQGTATAELEL